MRGWQVTRNPTVQRQYTRDDLAGLKQRHATLVGIDSDGCVFNTMHLKQKECFHPAIVEHWRLQAIEPLVRETAEFVNLHSKWRGLNRYVNLARLFDLLGRRPEVKAARIYVPSMDGLKRHLAAGGVASDGPVEEAGRACGDQDMLEAVAWSREVSRRVAAVSHRILPCPGAREALEAIRRDSDAICISQTPTPTIVEEWERNGLIDLVDVIAGAELGTKAEHIRLAIEGRYPPGRALMIGDAPGDEEAARANGIHFYPIIPEQEEASWARLRAEAYPRFLDDTYGGDYERELIAAFHRELPERPPWTPAGEHA